MLTVADVRELRRLYRDWPFFPALVGNLETTLEKSRLPIAASYFDLVPAGATCNRIWRAIEEEHLRVVAAVLDATGSTELLDGHPVLQRSIRLRNAYVDPMNAIQVSCSSASAVATTEPGCRCCARSSPSPRHSATPVDGATGLNGFIRTSRSGSDVLRSPP